MIGIMQALDGTGDLDKARTIASKDPPLLKGLNNDFIKGRTRLPSVRDYANHKYYRVHGKRRLWCCPHGTDRNCLIDLPPSCCEPQSDADDTDNCIDVDPDVEDCDSIFTLDEFDSIL